MDMPVMHDLHHKKGHTEPTTIVREIFDVSSDVFTWVKKEEKQLEKRHKWIKNIRNGSHFVLLTSIIFVILLCVSNWSAYSAYARVFLFPEELKQEQKVLEEGLENTEMNVQRNVREIKEEKRRLIMLKRLESMQGNMIELGATYFDQDISRVSLSVDIAPYENRIVIPKIGKNIPLVDVEHYDASNSNEWHKIFMKELENGIIKYPGSANPGEAGNSFIFGHSSNFPWAKGNYNDVFALLNELKEGDEITVYYKQKKLVYVVKEKIIVKPGNVSSLAGSEKIKRLTLMTCWPLGTTINRLLIVTELKNTPSV